MKEEDLGVCIGTVIAVEKVPGTKRLHKITIDIGNGKRKQIASGVPGDFEPDYLIGKQVPIKVDVKQIKIRGVSSSARFLTTTGFNGETVLLLPEKPVPNGSKVW